jgi:poly-gamma-glutamate capsule biosynthesis protein CapA/YwtB (metallophosphatase superfamily)
VRAGSCSIWLGIWLLSCARSDPETPKVPLAASSVVAPMALAAAPPSSLVAASSEPVPAAAPAPGAAAPEPSFVLAAGGDVNFGRECGQSILKDAGYDPFSDLGAAWRAADARFVNLESQLSDQHGVTQSPRHRLIFTGPPGGADVLSRAEISLVSTANNHAWDYGKSALLETILNLERAAVPFAGTGRDLESAYRPAVLQKNGLSLALFAVTHVWNQPPFASHEGRGFVAWADIDKLRAGIERARGEHDFVIVSYHGGEEYEHAPVERTQRFVAAVMALGVDAVIGHHPHVPQGVGWVAGRPIVYSLGNLVFAGHSDKPWTLQSFFARLELRRGAPPALSACPFALEGHRPRAFDLNRQRAVLERFRRHLSATSLYTGGAEVGAPDALGCLPVTPKAKRQLPLSSSN